ncbi:uncharacterized protein BJ212DRAFT_176367 [Suillus subaureus]|uniref:Uncharacterized protein n=1 Tax=Suillus subaureus TaxID=48587 RepID=A0A9P7EBG6_9AGAM|nr:uncharacterized protein BJ212DRAFT_176367 [Suillus subaureus]KAG1816817.1 hypothetical protein BJ212DRAFT_176367 [Suillus subaureus]
MLLLRGRCTASLTLAISVTPWQIRWERDSKLTIDMRFVSGRIPSHKLTVLRYLHHYCDWASGVYVLFVCSDSSELLVER